MKSSLKSIFTTFLIFILLSYFISCAQEKSFFAMSTVVTVKIYNLFPPDWNEIINITNQDAEQYDYRVYKGPIWFLNNQTTAKLPQNVRSIIEKAIHIAEISDGAYDPTILSVMKLWDFKAGNGIPDSTSILNALEYVDYKKIKINGQGNVSLTPGMGLDLSGIAKGAVVDNLAAYLENKGYDSFLIEAGGDILLSGLKPDDNKWNIGIKNPRDKERILYIIQLGEQDKKIALVTSGDYENFMVIDGIRYHHIIDPKTGYPARDLISVTVVANSCAKADALATAAFVKGFVAGYNFLETLPDVEGLLIKEGTEGFSVTKTSGFPEF